ncbi:SDR family oxidoreductase [Thiosulfatimonas sediminis]|uniref:SDR family oxidoreductase n=1 Tax=Thiosulfatimonas sediminis TaxID=2675054 RepID=A0A6F8PRA0_9GAMM|nr:SDR family NAD(P)-dependent oxidoreductase [Thiosulfatimonas sediminis]BBP44651.1 SDR family oxidoreductase [Thiosulfatimonas sediminis]
MSESVKRVWVFAATGGIGAAFGKELSKRFAGCQLVGFARNPEKIDASVFQQSFAFDLAQPEQFLDVIKVASQLGAPDYVLIASGWLHDADTQPEKTYRALNAQHLQKSYQLNAIGPVMLVQAILQNFGVKTPMKIGVLSARLGSISDNKMGGWHAYRASKAALNMLLKNIAIELKMKRSPITVFAIQPGTTDTRLSKPFQKGLPPEQLQTVEFTAQKICDLFAEVKLAHSGQLIDFAGNIIEP